VKDDQESRRWMALAGIGIEFAAAVGGFCLLGFWIDRHWQIEGHWGVLICAMLGIAGGMYNMIRQALRVSKSMSPPPNHEKRRLDEDV
jgi:F0F1-type ATP synthase assembly protein I